MEVWRERDLRISWRAFGGAEPGIPCGVRRPVAPFEERGRETGRTECPTETLNRKT